MSLPPHLPVMSISKLPPKERRRFSRLNTFVTSLGGDGGYQQSLQHYTQTHLAVECGNYSCLHLSGTRWAGIG